MNEDQLLVFNEKFKNIKYFKTIFLNAIKIYKYHYINIDILDLLYKNNFNCILSKETNDLFDFKMYINIYDFIYFKISYSYWNLDDTDVYKIYIKINNKLFSYEIINNLNKIFNNTTKITKLINKNKNIKINIDYLYFCNIHYDNYYNRIKKNLINTKISIYKPTDYYTYMHKKYVYKEYINKKLYYIIKIINYTYIRFNIYKYPKDYYRKTDTLYANTEIKKYYNNNYIYYYNIYYKVRYIYDYTKRTTDKHIYIKKYFFNKYYLINKYKILYII